MLAQKRGQKVRDEFITTKRKCSIFRKQEHAANLIIVLAAIDNETHLKALAQLSEMLSDPKMWKC